MRARVCRNEGANPGAFSFWCLCLHAGVLHGVLVPAGTDGPLPNVLALEERGGTHTSISTDASGRVLIRGTGEWEAADASVITSGLSKALTQGGDLCLFWDLGGLDRYQTVVRREATNWLVANFKGFSPTIHVLVANTMVAMAVSTAGVALSLVGVKVVSTRDPAQFRQHFEAAAASSTATAPPA